MYPNGKRVLYMYDDDVNIYDGNMEIGWQRHGIVIWIMYYLNLILCVLNKTERMPRMRNGKYMFTRGTPNGSLDLFKTQLPSQRLNSNDKTMNEWFEKEIMTDILKVINLFAVHVMRLSNSHF